MTFQDTMTAVFDGKRVRRYGWVPNVYITCDTCGISAMIHPIIVAENAHGERMTVHVYELSRMDFFAKDWEVVE